MSTATVAALLVLAWRFFVLTKEQAAWIEYYWGYYWVLAALALFVWILSRDCRVDVADLKRCARHHLGGVAIVIASGIFLHLHEPHCLKVLYDEPSHIAGSLMMHTERMAVMPGRAHYLYGGLAYLDLFPSFRLYLFQLLLSLFHDALGYSPSNVFLLNGILSFVFLGLVYLIGVRLVSRRAGVLAVLLFTSLPLLAQVVTSGSYDVLNLTLLAGLFLATLAYLEKPGADGLDLMLATGILLGLSRYESIIYLLVPVLAALWKWRKERQIKLTWFAIASPLLVVPNLVANKIMVSTEAYTLGSLREKLKVDFFNIDYIPDHLRESVVYFFSFNNIESNSLLFSAAGVLGLVCMAVSLGRRAFSRAGAVSEREGLVAVFVALTVALYALILANFWGSPTAIEATRFALPVHLAFALGALWLVRDLSPSGAVPVWMLVAVGAWVGLFTTPANSKHVATKMMSAANSYRWFADYASAHDKKRTLYAASSQIPMVIEGRPSVLIEHLNQHPERALQVIKAKIYDEVLVLELVPVMRSGEFAQPQNQNFLSGRFFVDLVAEDKFSNDFYSRILRIRAIKDAEGKVITPESMAPLKDQFENQSQFEAYYRGLLP